jgi:hypothetical protein
MGEFASAVIAMAEVTTDTINAQVPHERFAPLGRSQSIRDSVLNETLVASFS